MLTKDKLENTSDEEMIENCRIAAEEVGLFNLSDEEAVRYNLENAVRAKGTDTYMWGAEDDWMVDRLLEVYQTCLKQS